MDHKEQALEHLRNWDWDMLEVSADLSMQAAQVHATLALAEQQRIANLIALDDHSYLYNYSDDWNAKATLKPEIAEALGVK